MWFDSDFVYYNEYSSFSLKKWSSKWKEREINGHVPVVKIKDYSSK